MRKLDPDKHAARRGQILNAATQCFAERGFHQTSTAQICAAAGMSPGNLFHYFPSKDAIIEAIVLEDSAAMAARSAELAREDDLRAALRRMLDEALASLADPLYRRISMELMAEAVRNARLFALVAENEAARRAGWRRLLQGAQAKGQIAAGAEPELLVDALLVQLDGVFSRLLLDGDFDLDRYRDLLEQQLNSLWRAA
ncbi:TetR/AcrR family transcriptional regulator [Chitinimonas taiwanensis]|uniref:Transcriptional regulator, TetR family n=1 Tax=Chitinimonas taiwanensis DSM 18899 TaxID=1121279 RepID=A0A1K2HHG5_9NEIS|nr:TetR/AcrR family transcriptional regulator [Chitinimonas taiwanensis]SFZ75730.1 transcriptional regulator, TetR family [Chitinimonas taiwanensis DSM 18899]